VAIPTAFVACCIRIGNFFNQEILGTITSVPWAVVFGDPFDGSTPAPRHPVQLYEAICYLLTCFILLALWKLKRNKLRPGALVGLFFILIFGSRFIIEFWKQPQGMMIDESYLQTGQYLSIPFIVAGFWLFVRGCCPISSRSKV
jgi:phosphatidylglycerol---prolipoprotein diacylglyceryl transferase